MYPVSEDFLQALKEHSVEEDIKGTIYLQNGTSINISSSDIYNNTVSISSSAMDGNFSFGSANASTLNVELIDKYTEPYSFRGASILIKYGLKVGGVFEYVEFPKFYNAEVERQQNTIILTAVDSMAKLKSNNYTSGTNTLKSWLQNIASSVSLNLDSTVLDESFDSAMLNTDIEVDIEKNTEIETYWDLLNWLCYMLGAFAVIKRRNGIDELFLCNGVNGSNVDVDYKYCNDTTISDFDVSFYAVEMMVDNEVYTRYSSTSSGNYKLSLNTNPLINNSNYYNFLCGIANKLNTISYTPISQDYFGNPALEIGDRFITSGKTALLTSFDWNYSSTQHLGSANYTPDSLSPVTQTDKAVNAVKTTASTALNTAEISKAVADVALDRANSLYSNIIIYKNRFPILLLEDTVIADIKFNLNAPCNILFSAILSVKSTIKSSITLYYSIDNSPYLSSNYYYDYKQDISSGANNIINITFPIESVIIGNHEIKLIAIGNATVSKVSAWVSAPSITGEVVKDKFTADIIIPKNINTPLVEIDIPGKIDWGDGTINNNDGIVSHRYKSTTAPTNYTISVIPKTDCEIGDYFPCNLGAYYTAMGTYFRKLYFPANLHDTCFLDMPNLQELTFSPNCIIDCLQLSYMNITTLNIPSIRELKGKNYAGYSGSNVLTSLKVNFHKSTSPSIISNFCVNTSLTTVELTGQLDMIVQSCFSGCTSLTEITIPESVTQIGLNAFNGSTNLTIKGVAGSYAQTYANENGYTFIEI